ncbi:MAG: HEPN domain-containing protein [Deltaproteobacteria bacterium]|nr:MAG: HEPN domain-containing protein [Deltaproteobacteria bacterium]
MKPEIADLLIQAQESLAAAKTLNREGFYGFAAARAYYVMFYVAEAFLLSKSLSFNKHSAVISAFGEHFAKTGIVPREYHRFLLRGLQVRHAGDYGKARSVTPEESALQINLAEKFIDLASQQLGPLPA